MLNINLPRSEEKETAQGWSINQIKLLICGMVRTFINLAICDVSNIIFEYLKFSLINHLIYHNSKINIKYLLNNGIICKFNDKSSVLCSQWLSNIFNDKLKFMTKGTLKYILNFEFDSDDIFGYNFECGFIKTKLLFKNDFLENIQQQNNDKLGLKLCSNNCMVSRYVFQYWNPDGIAVCCIKHNSSNFVYGDFTNDVHFDSIKICVDCVINENETNEYYLYFTDFKNDVITNLQNQKALFYYDGRFKLDFDKNDYLLTFTCGLDSNCLVNSEIECKMFCYFE